MGLSVLYNYTGFLVQELLPLSPNAIQCFANLCMERLCPAISVSSHDVADEVVAAAQTAWDELLKGELPAPYSSHLYQIEQLLEGLSDADEGNDRWNIAEDALYAAQGMLHHLHSLDPVDAASCGRSVFGAVTQVAMYRHTTQYNFVSSYEVLWVSSVVQHELKQQQQTIQRLKASPLEPQELLQLRQEAQKLGDGLLHQLRQYEEEKTEKWRAAKANYHTGDTVYGYIKLFHPDGIIVKLDAQTYGISAHDASDISLVDSVRFQRRNLTAKVIGYDETNQRILLGAPHYHESFALPDVEVDE
jgi:hypothetical protein